MCGYLIYDSLFTAAFYSAVGSPSFVAHHVLGIACCCMGLYHNKCALQFVRVLTLGFMRLQTFEGLSALKILESQKDVLEIRVLGTACCSMGVSKNKCDPHEAGNRQPQWPALRLNACVVTYEGSL